ncbi:MAG TPA: ATP F0F1 synthase subunit B [Hyphomicrobiales bacterium]|nr:ATP F0F1 synthase subunit B [Hyphomicrobiales bacterium]
MPQLDFSSWPPQLIWLAITFGVLYLLMARIALPRIATVLEQRRDRIAADLAEAARLKQETEDALNAYEAALAEARSKAHAIAAETRDKLNAELDEESAKVEKQLAAKTAEAEERIDAMKQKALGEVDEAATETAEEIVRLLIGAKPAKKDVAAAVKAALSE